MLNGILSMWLNILNSLVCGYTDLKRQRNTICVQYGMCRCNICDLTFIAIYYTIPWFTRKTLSILYVTRVVVTINGARIVTLATVKTSIFTTCINKRMNYTRI